MLPVAYIYGQTVPNLSGKIVEYHGDLSLLRVRLISMYGSDVQEARPNEGGNFDFPVDNGSYVLMSVIDGEGGPIVADWRNIRIQGRQSVTIDLGKLSK